MHTHARAHTHTVSFESADIRTIILSWHLDTQTHNHTHLDEDAALPISPSLSVWCVHVPCNNRSRGHVSFKSSTPDTALERKQGSDSFGVSNEREKVISHSDVHWLLSVWAASRLTSLNQTTLCFKHFTSHGNDTSVWFRKVAFT